MKSTPTRILRAGLVLSHALLLYCFLPLVHASVFITHPYRGISCSAGQECTVTWADDGRTPLLAAVGPSDFALFQGTNTLVQQLATGLDVSQTRELTFVPNRNAGPNSDAYWIMLTSVSARDPNDTSQPYTSFSGFFTLDNMAGVEGSPVASLTSSLPSSSVPQSPGPASGSSSTSETNGVVGTTTLSGPVPTESASALSSALSAISSAASGSLGSSSSRLVTSATSPPSATSPGSTTGTGAGSNSTGTSSTSWAVGRGGDLTSGCKLGAALIAAVLASQTSAMGFL